MHRPKKNQNNWESQDEETDITETSQSRMRGEGKSTIARIKVAKEYMLLNPI